MDNSSTDRKILSNEFDKANPINDLKIESFIKEEFEFVEGCNSANKCFDLVRKRGSVVDKVDIEGLLKGMSSLTRTVATLTKTVESMCKTQLKVLTELASLNDRLMQQDEREKNRIIRKWKKSGEASSFMSTSSKRYTVKKNTQPVSVLLEGL